MELPDNIIKHFLRNVYFVSGCACGGKTTISKYLAEKHQMYLYNWDSRFDRHKEISDLQNQPYMYKKYSSWEEYFNRPPKLYAHDLRNSVREQVEVSIVELLSLSVKETRIIVDGIFSSSILNRISSKERVLFLLADPAAIRVEYFNRPDKKAMLECINGLHNPEQSLENVFVSMETWLNNEMPEIQQSEFLTITRSRNTNWEHVRQEVEKHFNLC
jgi:hypothetical protein